jgi:hypothetical protein
VRTRGGYWSIKSDPEAELKIVSEWNHWRAETELNSKFYRQATNQIVGISAEAAAFLREFF